MLLTAGFSAVYVSKAFFWDYDFWFDGYAYFFLLLGMGLRNRLAIFLSLQLACWTDERAVVALASVYLFHALQETGFDLRSLRQAFDRSFFVRPSGIVLLAGVAYLGGRLLLAQAYQLATPSGVAAGVGLGLLPFQLKHRLIGVFLSFEGLWVVFFLAIRHFFVEKAFVPLLAMTVVALVHVVVAYCVYDITRSLSYGFPLFIIAGIVTARTCAATARTALLATALLCWLIPTQFLIYYPRQIPWTLTSFAEMAPVLRLVLGGK